MIHDLKTSQKMVMIVEKEWPITYNIRPGCRALVVGWVGAVCSNVCRRANNVTGEKRTSAGETEDQEKENKKDIAKRRHLGSVVLSYWGF